MSDTKGMRLRAIAVGWTLFITAIILIGSIVWTS